MIDTLTNVTNPAQIKRVHVNDMATVERVHEKPPVQIERMPVDQPTIDNNHPIRRSRASMRTELTHRPLDGYRKLTPLELKNHYILALKDRIGQRFLDTDESQEWTRKEKAQRQLTSECSLPRSTSSPQRCECMSTSDAASL